MRIVLQLFKVYNKEIDAYINFTMFFFYNTGEVRPKTIKIDSNSHNLSSENILKELEHIIERFKITDLKTAFIEMMSITTTSFKWKEKEGIENIIDIDVSYLLILLF